MLMRTIRKYILNRFFNKILLVNAVIVVLALSMLTLIGSLSVSNLLLQREIKYNKLILSNTNRYLDMKIDLIKKITEQAYHQDEALPDVFSFLENNYDSSSMTINYYDEKQRFSDYFRSAFSRDQDIKSIVMYKKVDSSFYVYSRNYEHTYKKKEFNYLDRLLTINYYPSTLTIFPSISPFYLQDEKIKIFSLTLNLKVPWSTENLGMLIVDFDVDGISQILKQYEKDLQGDILILTRNGEVIFDSSNTYYGRIYPYTGKLLAAEKQSAVIDGKTYVVNVDRENNTGLIVAGIIPQTQILSSFNSTKQFILILSLVCILISILLSFLSTNLFSKRIKILTDAMKIVRAGNLSFRVPIKKNVDEINMISVDFNQMVEDLEINIKKSYDAELSRKDAEIRQKSAEMTALQAQINPHFLYNTLEAIRMNAVSNGANDVGRMIFSLSRLFRNSIKAGTIISVKDEISNSQLYLTLFQIRYGDKLNIEFEIQEDINHLGIIKHTIQPIIENYFIHGFHPLRNDNCIRITGYCEKDDLIFKVSDNGVGIEASKLKEIQDRLASVDSNHTDSIGLVNVNERIKLKYDHRYGINIESIYNEGTTVTIRMAALTLKELMNDV